MEGSVWPWWVGEGELETNEEIQRERKATGGNPVPPPMARYTIANPTIYRRYRYRNCVQKNGWDKFLPIDLFNRTQLKNMAKKHYEHIYTSLAAYASSFPFSSPTN